MDRKKFLRRGLASMAVAVVTPQVLISCKKDEVSKDYNGCTTSPAETEGPFPIKTPADWVRANITGSKKGIPLMVTIKVENTNNGCAALEGVNVDIWHCDAKGNYSEYSGQLDGDFTSDHFFRGRQLTDANGEVTFITIYPGWYPGRAPHIHFEIKTQAGKSLLITQTAFPENVSRNVYGTAEYSGTIFDTSNAEDGEFSDSLAGNLVDSFSGNNTDGYTLKKTIKVAG